MNTMKYKTADVLASLAKFYSRKNIQLLPGSSPRTDGETIWVPSLPAELTTKQLRTLRCYVDHEAAHIRCGSFGRFRKKHPNNSSRFFKESAMGHITTIYPGSLGKMVLNSLEDARIEHQMAEEFDGVDFSEMHADFCGEDLGDPQGLRALIHMLYLNSRLGWGHNPACEYWEGVLGSVKGTIMRAHQRAHAKDILADTIEVMEILNSAPPPESDEPEEEDGADVNETGQQESEGEQADDGGNSDSEPDTDGEPGDDGEPDGDGESGDGGDGDAEGESDADGDADGDTGGESGDESSDDEGDAKSSGNGGGDDTGQAESDGEGAGGNSGNSSMSKPQSAGEALEREAESSDGGDHGKAMADNLKPEEGQEVMSPESFSDAGGTAKFRDYDPASGRGDSYRKGSARGSMLGRLIKSKIISYENTGHTPPRSSGSNVHRGNLAKFASGCTGRVLTRNVDAEDVSADVVLCLDISGSIDDASYRSLFNACGCIERALTMGGASVGVVYFGEEIIVAKEMSSRSCRSLKMPTQQGNTDTGNAMIEASKMLASGSGNRKICVVLTDGHPGSVTQDYDGSPCDAAMRRLHNMGSELICIPFDCTKEGLRRVRSKLASECTPAVNTDRVRESYIRYFGPINKFIKYMIDNGVYVKSVERSPRIIAKQILEFRGDLRNYLGKSIDVEA